MTAATAREVRLDRLLEGIADAPALRLAGMKMDARTIVPGEAFAALQGLRCHGLQFVGQALSRGARAVLWDPGEAAAPDLPEGVAAVAVPALRSHLGKIADRCYGSPSARLSIAGVTGTNGKTTCAWLLADAGSRLGPRVAYLGTLGAGFPPALEPASHTTPDALGLHATLAGLESGGAGRVAMEVSSHALDQDRLAGVRMHIAAFTNLTRDHLDYHGTMDAYASAKQRIFGLAGVSHAVINVSDAAGRSFAEGLPGSVALTAVSVGAPPDIAAAEWLHVAAIEAGDASLILTVVGTFGERRLRSPLVAAFNAENLAVVLGVLLAWGHAPDEAIAALEAAGPPPGRMEGFRAANGSLAIVDYAHTPDALAKVLEAARRHARYRVRVVFGCGGDRDPGKRALMGEVAERLADDLFVTDDNPRHEDPERIVAMILSGMRTPDQAIVIRDRGAAIEAAMAGTGPGDVVVIAGKGHETQQLVAGEAREFSDREWVGHLTGARP